MSMWMMARSGWLLLLPSVVIAAIQVIISYIHSHLRAMDPFAFNRLAMHGGHPTFMAREFKSVYRCFPINMLRGNERASSNYGGKIFLPQSALAKLSELHIEYPMLFTLNKNGDSKITHAGVLEFIAEEGRMYAPDWMMRTLQVDMGDLVCVTSTSLPLGKFVKIQPQSVDFLDITDPKAVLEQAFRSFSALTKGDVISIHYNNKLYDILIMEARPEGAGISIIETDLEVDFAAPVGYKEPEPVARRTGGAATQSASSIAEHTVKQTEAFQAFKGSGQRLNGRSEAAGSSYGGMPISAGGPSGSRSNASLDSAAASLASAAVIPGGVNSDGVPDALRLPPGKLFFGYPVVPLKKNEGVSEADNSPFSGLSGPGNTLRAARKGAKPTDNNQ